MMKITKKQETNKLSAVLKGIILGFVIMMSLYHVCFDDKSKKLVDHKEVYNALIDKRTQIDSELIQNLLNDSLTKQEYALAVIEHKKLFKEKLRACNNEKKNIAYDFTFNGRNSFHYWLFVFGISFSFFFLALRYTFRIISEVKNGDLKKSLIFESIGWIAISLFWVIHTVFKKTDDLPTIIYAITMFSVCIVLGFSIFYSIKYLIHRKEHTLKSYKASIINLIELIGEIRVNHYFKMAAKAMTKENKEIISKDSEVMDKKIFSTLEKVADGE